MKYISLFILVIINLISCDSQYVAEEKQYSLEGNYIGFEPQNDSPQIDAGNYYVKKIKIINDSIFMNQIPTYIGDGDTFYSSSHFYNYRGKIIKNNDMNFAQLELVNCGYCTMQE